MKGKFKMISESSQPLQLCVLCPSAGIPPFFGCLPNLMTQFTLYLPSSLLQKDVFNLAEELHKCILKT